MLDAKRRPLVPAAAPARGALKKSLLLHVGVLGLVLLLPYLHVPPKVEPPRVVEAVLVSGKTPTPAPVPVKPVPAPEPEPQPEPKPEPKPQPKPEPLPVPKIKVPDAVKPQPKIALPKVDEKKPLPEKVTPKAEPKPEPVKPAPPKPLIKPQQLKADDFEAEIKALKQQSQKEEADRLAHEADKAMANARSSANQAIRDKYERLINQRVQTKWNRPLSARRGMVVTLRISVLPGGEVTNVVTVKSSGDPAFDASAEDAVRKANPLPVPDDVTAFNQYFRVITLKFNPEDL